MILGGFLDGEDLQIHGLVVNEDRTWMHVDKGDGAAGGVVEELDPVLGDLCIEKITGQAQQPHRRYGIAGPKAMLARRKPRRRPVSHGPTSVVDANGPRPVNAERPVALDPPGIGVFISAGL